MRPLVALDVDGILADFLEGALDAIHHVTGRHYHSQEVSQWCPWLQFKLQPEETEAVFDLIGTPGFCESLQLLPGAREGVDSLRKVANIVVVTSPWLSSPTWAFERTAWLKRHFGFTENQIVHTSAKQYISADVFVDDHATNVRAWAATNSGIPLMWDCTHNRRIDLPRVTGWDQLIKIVTDLKKGIAA